MYASPCEVQIRNACCAVCEFWQNHRRTDTPMIQLHRPADPCTDVYACFFDRVSCRTPYGIIFMFSYHARNARLSAHNGYSRENWKFSKNSVEIRSFLNVFKWTTADSNNSNFRSPIHERVFLFFFYLILRSTSRKSRVSAETLLILILTPNKDFEEDK